MEVRPDYFNMLMPSAANKFLEKEREWRTMENIYYAVGRRKHLLKKSEWESGYVDGLGGA